jgi:xylulokinase
LGGAYEAKRNTGIVVRSDLKLVYEAKVDFDADFKDKYGIEKGVLQNKSENEIFAPVALWLEALELVLSRLRDDGLDFSKVKGASGAGMQHGTVFWGEKADDLLGNLDAKKSLLDQLLPAGAEDLEGAFAHPYSPNWQDASTQAQCEAFDGHLGSPEKLAEVTGSKAHHVWRF